VEKPKLLSLSDCQNLTLRALSESELVALIQEASKGFTTDRKNIHQYVEDEKKVSAYALFYLPTNMPKLYFLLDQLVKIHGEDFLKKLATKKFIDVGSGPGTFSLALLFYLKNRELNYPEIHLIDQSPLMLKQAQKILLHFFPEVKITQATSDLNIVIDNEAILFFGHSLNEFSAEQIDRYIKLIEKNKNISEVMWIEPGTPSFFHKQLSIRESLIHSGMSILYPCPNMKACPLAKISEGEGPEWCHQILRLTHHPEIERISQLVSLDRKILPMTAMVFSRATLVKNAQWFFPLKFLNETKFSFDYLFCGEFETSELTLKKGELLKKSLSKKAIRNLKDRSLGYPLLKNDQNYKLVSDFFRVSDKSFLSDYAEDNESSEVEKS